MRQIEYQAAAATAAVVLALALQPGVAKAQSGVCKDPWVTRAITEIAGRAPVGQGDTEECDITRYGGGHWTTYADLVEKVKAGLLDNNRTIKARERCFGSQGSGCDGLALGNEAAKAGRTRNADGTYNIWISVGSINHDNCCVVHPNGKMCGGNPAAQSLTSNGDGHCVAEWDKAFWNAVDGRAWTERFNPNREPNLRIVAGRQSRARTGQALHPWETQETRQYAAPAGQALDPGDQAYCRSGQATTYNLPGTPKTWIVCK